MHDVVQVVHGEAAILASLSSNAAQSILAVAAWFVSTLAGEQTGYKIVSLSELFPTVIKTYLY